VIWNTPLLIVIVMLGLDIDIVYMLATSDHSSFSRSGYMVGPNKI